MKTTVTLLKTPVGLMEEGGMSDARCWGRQAPGGRSKSCWIEWLEDQHLHGGCFDFQAENRVFEYSDSFAPRGWKPYDMESQVDLQRIFHCEMNADFETHYCHLDCLGWSYLVKFDLFHNCLEDFHSAPSDAIGFQLSSHEASNNTKRWIRLATF